MARVFAPPTLRPVYECGDALEVEFEALAAPALDHGVAHVKLAWWREECARLGAGAPRHPLTRGLAERGAGGPAAHAVLSLALDATARRIAGYVPADEEDLLSELGRSSGLGSRLATLNAADTVRERAQSLAVAVALIALVSEVRVAARAGDLRLPLAPLDAAGIEPAALSGPALPEPVVLLLQSLLGRALALIDAGPAAMPHDEHGHTKAPARAALRSAEVEAALAARRARSLLLSRGLEPARSTRSAVWRDFACALATAWGTRS